LPDPLHEVRIAEEIALEPFGRIFDKGGCILHVTTRSEDDAAFKTKKV
jgi:hypothetical protein